MQREHLILRDYADGIWPEIHAAMGLLPSHIDESLCPYCSARGFNYIGNHQGEWQCIKCQPVKRPGLYLVARLLKCDLYIAFYSIVDYLHMNNKKPDTVDFDKIIASNPRQRSADIDALCSELISINVNTPLLVNVRNVEDVRRLPANKLMWVWNTQIAKYLTTQEGKNISKIGAHARNKMWVLLPMMTEIPRLQEEARYIINALEGMAEGPALFFVNKAVETKTLYISEFTDYLKNLEGFWTPHIDGGLKSKKEDRDAVFNPTTEDTAEADAA